MPSLYPDPDRRRLASDRVAAGGACARVRRRPTVGPAKQGSELAVTTAVQKVAFDNGGAFIRETRREVEQYLARGSTRLNGSLLLYAKAPVAIGLIAASWTVLVFARPGLDRRIPLPRRACAGRDAERLLRTARREPRRVLPAAPLQQPPRLDGGRPARLLELRLAREAQRRPPHLHERRRLRRRRHPGAARPVYAVAGAEAVVPIPALLHLADVRADGAALADGRRHRGVRARQRSARARCGRPAAGTSRA